MTSPRFALALSDSTHKLLIIAGYMNCLTFLQVKYVGKRSKTKMDLSIKMYADEVEVRVGFVTR